MDLNDWDFQQQRLTPLRNTMALVNDESCEQLSIVQVLQQLGQLILHYPLEYLTQLGTVRTLLTLFATFSGVT